MQWFSNLAAHWNRLQKKKATAQATPRPVKCKTWGEGTDVRTFQDPSGNFKIEPHLGTSVLSSCFSNVNMYTKHLGIF